MSKNDSDDARIFPVDTNFQRMARRPGGISRDEAIRNADAKVDAYKPGFASWLEDELEQLLRIIPPEDSPPGDLSWLDAADVCCQRLTDVGATMDYEFVSFVASNLCIIFEAFKAGAQYRGDVVACHVNALLLAKQTSYRRLRSEDLPELSEGLRRVIESKGLRTNGEGQT
jgi:hypothetical protein